MDFICLQTEFSHGELGDLCASGGIPAFWFLFYFYSGIRLFFLTFNYLFEPVFNVYFTAPAKMQQYMYYS
jgi:hypothetical protein